MGSGWVFPLHSYSFAHGLKVVALCLIAHQSLLQKHITLCLVALQMLQSILGRSENGSDMLLQNFGNHLQD
jgi:hypothetical protein